MALLSAFCESAPYEMCGKPVSKNLLTSSASDGGDDGELISFGDLGVGAVEVADVLVALVHVDERAELAVAGVEVLLEVGVLGGEVVQSVTGVLAVDLDLRVAVRVLSQRSGDIDLWHVLAPLLLLGYPRMGSSS